MTTIECDGIPVEIDERCIELAPGMWWVPHHAWGDGSDQIDARIITAAGVAVPGGCDIWAAGVVRAECSPATVAAVESAEEVWAAGEVLVAAADLLGATSLIVPGEEITEEVLREALRRFRP